MVMSKIIDNERFAKGVKNQKPYGYFLRLI